MSNIQKRFLGSFCLLLLTCSAGAKDIADIAPNWQLHDADNNIIDFYVDSNEQVSVLLFWATWCPYCKRLMPHLQDVANQYSDSAVKFYALNIKEDKDPVKYLQDNHYDFILIKDADIVAESYDVYGTPGLMVIDSQHRIAYVRKSGESDETVKKATVKAIESLLNK